jgi:iron complex outermembrane recepter protein
MPLPTSALPWKIIAEKGGPHVLGPHPVKGIVSIAAAVIIGGLGLSGALAQETGRAPKEGLPTYSLPSTDIIGTTPVEGTGVERAKVPANVQTLDRPDIEKASPLSLGDVLNSRMGSTALNDVQNNPLQPDIQIRGFTASPLLGSPEGIAVYQNGSRVNEAFGDVVQWDTIPQFAIDSVQLIPGSNPAFGLNALGGALALRMKNGFDFQGSEAEAFGGSFGRWRVTGQTGIEVGDLAFYGGVSGFAEDGWRQLSPSNLQQVYGDARWRGVGAESAFNLVYTNSNLLGNGPSPIQLLQEDRSAIFTAPDQTKNELFGIATQNNFTLNPSVSLQANAYYRHLQRDTANGDDSDLDACDSPEGFLCPEEAPDHPVTDTQGNPIPSQVNGQEIGNGVFNTTGTTTDMVGGAAQIAIEEPLFALTNHLVLGTSLDAGFVKYDNRTQVGTLNPDRSVTGSGFFLGGDEFNTRLRSTNVYVGAYFSDTLSLTDALAATVAGRFNYAIINLTDELGTELTGDHHYDRFDPAAGLTYQLTPEVNLFGGYSESNRAPTPVELSCADPTQPCRVPNAFVSDPPLDQVVTRSVEAGARGALDSLAGLTSVRWSVAGFGSRNRDDIIFVSAGPTLGTGFFKNAGTTQRVGAELRLDGDGGPIHWFVKYGFVDATFRSSFKVASPNHPDAVDDQIQVTPGDRIPSIPQNTVKIGLDYQVSAKWTIGVESIIASDQFLRGDESNQLDPVGGYGIVNLATRYQINGWAEVFAMIDNVFDAKYNTFGTLGDPTNVFPDFTDPRFLSPGAPIGGWAGVRIKL